MMMDQMYEAFEQWHNEFYGPQDEFRQCRSLERYPPETGLGYCDTTVQAQFALFCDLQSRLYAAEKERDEALAWGERMERAIRYAHGIFLQYEQLHLAKGPEGLEKAVRNAEHAAALEQAMCCDTPAALSTLRQQVRLETIREVVAEWEKPWSQAPSQFVERLYKMLAEEQEGKNEDPV